MGAQRRQVLGGALLLFLGLSLVLELVRSLPREGQAQQIQACVPSKTLVNVAGNLTDIIVPSTPVLVLSINQAACQRLISNVGTASMRCLPSNQGPPNVHRASGQRISPRRPALCLRKRRCLSSPSMVAFPSFRPRCGWISLAGECHGPFVSLVPLELATSESRTEQSTAARR